MTVKPVVLLVDDDPSMRELLSTMFLLHGGFRIGGVAHDGFEGAMLACDIAPDVAVVDFFMPRWDGAKAAAFIHKHRPECKVIAFSAVLDDPPEWADAFLVKNDIDRLIPLAERLVGQGAKSAG